MTIRRRLIYSFLTILSLFAANLGVYFWSNRKRQNSVEELGRAVASQLLLASVDQKLNTVQKEVALLSQVVVEKATEGARPADIAEFDKRLQGIADDIQEIEKQADQQSTGRIAHFSSDYDQLRVSWHVFYTNFGRNQAKAVGELAMRAEPLSQALINQSLPELQKNETVRVKTASDNFYSVARLTDKIIILIFAVSILIAMGIAYRLSRDLTTKLWLLKLGTRLVGEGSFSYRIPVASKDELGEVAIAYNQMADKLDAARNEMTVAHQELEARNVELDKQRELSESLLLNILPQQVADELRAKSVVAPKYFEDVTILFTDFVGFTLSTEKLAAEELVDMLHLYFTDFDNIMHQYKLEKLKTIGDSYMCAAGMPVGRRARRTPSHPVDAVMAAFEMAQAVRLRHRPESRVHWQVRIGLHTGPVVAGVVGIQKFAFDIWGDTVNYASRMESSGMPGRINLSAATYARVKDFFECEYRGKILTKDKREVDMYFANGLLPGLVDDASQVPPPAFVRRYEVYFQKQPPWFPGFLLDNAERATAKE